jgi:biopolymer transport protein ExbD
MMDLIPDEELKSKSSINLTSMVDFLFLVIALFATLAITRTALFDSEISLAKIHSLDASSKDLIQTIHLSVTKNGTYKWVTEFNEYRMEGIPAILQELSKQQSQGILGADKSKTKILLHIDKQTEWDPIAQLVYSLKKTGYMVHPVYELANNLDENRKI